MRNLLTPHPFASGAQLSCDFMQVACSTSRRTTRNTASNFRCCRLPRPRGRPRRRPDMYKVCDCLLECFIQKVDAQPLNVSFGAAAGYPQDGAGGVVGRSREVPCGSSQSRGAQDGVEGVRQRREPCAATRNRACCGSPSFKLERHA